MICKVSELLRITSHFTKVSEFLKLANHCVENMSSCRTKFSRANLQYIARELAAAHPNPTQKFYFGVLRVVRNEKRWDIATIEKVEVAVILQHLDISGLNEITLHLLKQIVCTLKETNNISECIKLLDKSAKKKPKKKNKRKRKISAVEFIDYGEEYGNKYDQISSAHFFETMERRKKIKLDTNERNFKVIRWIIATGMKGLNLKLTSSTPSNNSNSNSNSKSNSIQLLNDDNDDNDNHHNDNNNNIINNYDNSYNDEDEDDDLLLHANAQKQCPHCTLLNPPFALMCTMCLNLI